MALSRHFRAAMETQSDPLKERCPICGADVSGPCLEITATPVVIRKNKTKRTRDMLSDIPVRTPHAARVEAARKR